VRSGWTGPGWLFCPRSVGSPAVPERGLIAGPALGGRAIETAGGRCAGIRLVRPCLWATGRFAYT